MYVYMYNMDGCLYGRIDVCNCVCVYVCKKLHRECHVSFVCMTWYRHVCLNASVFECVCLSVCLCVQACVLKWAGLGEVWFPAAYLKLLM